MGDGFNAFRKPEGTKKDFNKVLQEMYDYD